MGESGEYGMRRSACYYVRSWAIVAGVVQGPVDKDEVTVNETVYVIFAMLAILALTMGIARVGRLTEWRRQRMLVTATG